MKRDLFAYSGLLAFILGLKSLKPDWIHEDILFIWAFFAFLAYLSNLLHGIGMQKEREKLIPFHMATQGVRFLCSLLFVGTFAYLKVENIYLFIINFFVLYLFSTYFEISGLLRKLRRF
ncbi:MAG: hypothetical protein RJA76_2196 [Bacteroidota bacterium]|jgi:hypothetical protein